ncbi:hypothetical protein FKD06_24435 [Serratia sp. SRS-8-S-2018]|uniref:ATP-dependent Clp protease proteolytic subunit n=1 Tax=Serratia sp. SRS-8-S-2018 TaxID=2591107 RepID=UPI0011405DCF|nr:ATP-dependent Clp protease proteolytic subunit [Serratia sp. SRS-8-S-2018]TPW41103.1 hypothetical protein FKD06_24435 [Serratia sp. SRS-8-S-2018]
MKKIFILLAFVPFLTFGQIASFKLDDAKKVERVKIVYDSGVNSSSVRDLALSLDEINTNYHNLKEITMYINSSGGDMFSGQMAATVIKSSRVPVTTINAGLVASAATLMFCAADKRETFPNSLFILHPAQTSLSGKYRPDELKNEQQILEYTETIFKSTYTACTKFTEEQISKFLYSEGTRGNITAKTAMKFGLASGVTNRIGLSDTTYFITDDDKDK